MNMNFNSVNRQPYFQLQNGKLDVQAKQFIKQFDTDLDGSLSQEEVSKSSGLMGAVQTKVSSPQLAQALWASIAGPSNTINAKEYAALLLGVDADRNGMITQFEADAWVKKDTETFKLWGADGVQDIYKGRISNGNQVGLDQAFGITKEEQFALGETTKEPPRDEGALLNSEPLSKEDLLAFSTAQAGENPEVKAILAKETMLQVPNFVASILNTTEAATPGTTQYAVAMKRMEKQLDAEFKLQKQQKALKQFVEQIQDEVRKQGVGDKTSPELDAFRATQKPVLDKLLVDLAKEEIDSPAYQIVLKKVLDIDKADYALYLKANPEVAQIIQDISRKNAIAIQNGTFQVKEVSLDNYKPMAWSQQDDKMDSEKAKAFKSKLSTIQTSITRLSEELDYIVNNLSQDNIARGKSISSLLKSLTIQENNIKNQLITIGYPVNKPDATDLDTTTDTEIETNTSSDSTDLPTTPASDDIDLPLL